MKFLAITSKYRKNEYIIRYSTMNGANMAFKIPMNINRRRNLSRALEKVHVNGPRVIYPSTNAARFLDFKKTFLTLPLRSNKYSIKQKRRFHSSDLVSMRPLPSSGGTKRCRLGGRGTRRSSNSLLNNAIK